jgi:hypothetical protein
MEVLDGRRVHQRMKLVLKKSCARAGCVMHLWGFDGGKGRKKNMRKLQFSRTWFSKQKPGFPLPTFNFKGFGFPWYLI